MKFKDYLESGEYTVNESAAAIAQKFVSDSFNKKNIEFEYTAMNKDTGDIESGKVKFGPYEIFDKLSGGTRMLENTEVLKIMHGDKTTINEWKNWLLKEAFKYTFQQGTMSAPKVIDIVVEKAYPGKPGWSWTITSLSYSGTNFYKKEIK